MKKETKCEMNGNKNSNRWNSISTNVIGGYKKHEHLRTVKGKEHFLLGEDVLF